jgi:thioredoxin-related protein
MKKENIFVVVIVCVLIAGVGIYYNSKPGKLMGSIQEKESGQTSDKSAIDWQEYAKGMDLAKKENKPVFLYFHADWCSYCKKLKKTTFQDALVLKYLRDNFISITVDTDKDQERAAQWKVKGLPTLWFLKPDNSRITSIPGYIDAEQFLNALKYIQTASYDKMSFPDFIKTI